MAEQKPRQFFRDIKPGDVSIEGRQSNGITADNSGNVFIYSGLKEAELEDLTKQQYRGNVPIYYGNSYIAVAKSQTHETLQLGNNNYETVNAQTDPNKIVVATQPTSSKPIVSQQSLTNITSSITASTIPTIEPSVPSPAPLANGEFEFLDETQFTLEPVQLTEKTQYVAIAQSAEILPNGNIVQGKGTTVKIAYTNVNNIPLLKDKTFITEVKKIANDFGLKAEDLLKIMINESGLNPAASLYRKCLNSNCSGTVLYSNTPKAGYTLFAGGLIGFIRPYAPSVCEGNSIDIVITKDALTQLRYVKNFLTPLKSTLKGADAALLYMHFAIPALVSKMKSGDNSTLLAFKGVSAETVSAQNPGLATAIGKKPGDPLTIGDFRKFVNIKFGYNLLPF